MTPLAPLEGATPGQMKSAWPLASPSTLTPWTRPLTRPLWGTGTPWGKSEPRYCQDWCFFSGLFVDPLNSILSTFPSSSSGQQASCNSPRFGQRHNDLGRSGEQVSHLWGPRDQQEGGSWRVTFVLHRLEASRQQSTAAVSWSAALPVFNVTTPHVHLIWETRRSLHFCRQHCIHVWPFEKGQHWTRLMRTSTCSSFKVRWSFNKSSWCLMGVALVRVWPLLFNTFWNHLSQRQKLWDSNSKSRKLQFTSYFIHSCKSRVTVRLMSDQIRLNLKSSSKSVRIPP